ncbi:MAG TPA: hypothetical protein VN181_04240 [Thermoanaerobaculia bacterium]|nr:hypothetical protein [Thermoanaerobaculia bacterium]
MKAVLSSLDPLDDAMLRELANWTIAAFRADGKEEPRPRQHRNIDSFARGVWRVFSREHGEYSAFKSTYLEMVWGGER